MNYQQLEDFKSKSKKILQSKYSKITIYILASVTGIFLFSLVAKVLAVSVTNYKSLNHSLKNV